MNSASGPGPDTARHVVVNRERREGARVTVAVSLFDYRDYVVSCLESVKAQTIRDLDLVIVDDCSRDGGGDVAQRWLEENGERFCRWVLVRHEQNEGLAAARNTAFAHARTDHVFVLDADNLLYPRCLEQLASALGQSGASFAYCYLEKFGDLSGLLNIRPWNRDGLQHGNRIDAMVLLRRSVWQAVGGYAHDMPAMGWEDFELWFKIARIDGWGIQVPEILGRYCVHRDSMLQTVTNPQMDSLWEYLRSKYPEFFTEQHLERSHPQARSITLRSDGANTQLDALDMVMERPYSSDEDCSTDCGLLEDSGLLDVTTYCAAAGLATGAHAAKHYLLHGWRANLEPNQNFDGRFLYPYYRSAGFDGPPALTFIKLRAAGWPVYATRAQAQETAKTIGSSTLFDAVGYAARAGGLEGLDPALHYVLVGEQMGLAPSTGFDPEYYRDRNPDVSDAAISGLGHYLEYGRSAGRRPISVAETLTFDRQRLDASRETILLIVHDASRTDAPLIAYNIAVWLRQKYNVVAVLLAAGELFDDFETCCAAVVGPIPRSEWCDVEAKYLVRRLCASYRVLYAIANSIETRMMLPPLAHAHVPVVTLVHEFASYTRPAGSMGRALDWSTHVVFPAGLAADSARKEHPTLCGRTIHVLPQGPCPAPTTAKGVPETAPNGHALLDVLRQREREQALVVFGCGTVQIRKGVDLFLSCAAAVAKLGSRRPVRFVWIGEGYQPKDDASYSCYLADQIERAGLVTTVSVIDNAADVEPAYAMADVFLLSSRLDPLPNVAIGAALRGIPVVCFEDATGMAGILATDALTSQCVVPYLDVNAAAALITKLADNERERAEIGEATRRIALATFDMDRYVRRLDELGIDAARIMRQRSEDFTTLRYDSLFDASVYLHPNWPIPTRDEAISGFLARWLAVGVRRHPASNGLFRRPCAGFHPQIYAHEHRDRYDASCINPVAHFIRNGKPEGAWWHEVIVPRTFETGVAADAELKVALHGHFFYPELAADLLRRLSANHSRCDLLFTTDDDRKAQLIGEAARRYDRGKVLIRLVPNRGRDIGALMTAFGDDVLGNYDVVGHVHGKRSVHIDGGAGDSWREFLWQHLIGDCHPMMDLILGRLARDRGLGIVFPDDPHLPDWDDNQEVAAHLATRMGMVESLPPFFDFPIGTMFWARTEALRPLFALKLDWTDYPMEPVPADGTILHALERLLPFAARHAGYRYATTHVPGSTWAL